MSLVNVIYCNAVLKNDTADLSANKLRFESVIMCVNENKIDMEVAPTYQMYLDMKLLL